MATFYVQQRPQATHGAATSSFASVSIIQHFVVKQQINRTTNNICIHHTEEESDEVPDDVFLFYGQPVAVLSTSLLTFTTSDLKSVSDF